MLGNRSKEEVAAGNRDYRMGRAMAIFAVGIDSLARGECDTAKEYFQAVRKTNMFSSYVETWSMLFLERMQEDPNWLPCPARQPARAPPGR